MGIFENCFATMKSSVYEGWDARDALAFSYSSPLPL